MVEMAVTRLLLVKLVATVERVALQVCARVPVSVAMVVLVATADQVMQLPLVVLVATVEQVALA